MADEDLPVLIWRKSSASDPDDCVEVAFEGGGVRVRDSKRPTGPNVAFCPATWSNFLHNLCRRYPDPTVR
ncbi:DUF397 domain-containing protein [Streptomyces umbrinus]|uniref:DUF397 domain-containing protein n=1 Tax=Streptomyces umbrinus TaxID=67370 RepID=UPI0027D91482|nr:DUF397 domain-containing protein [Streptomyces umbrinus]